MIVAAFLMAHAAGRLAGLGANRVLAALDFSSGGCLAWAFALLRVAPTAPPGWSRGAILAVLVVDLAQSRFHRPRSILVPASAASPARRSSRARFYISAMPTYQGLKLAQDRHHFRTIINLLSRVYARAKPHWPDELRFVREHGLKYLGNSSTDGRGGEEFVAQTTRPGPRRTVAGRFWCTVTPAWIARRRGWAFTASWSRVGRWSMPSKRSSGTAVSVPRVRSRCSTPASCPAWLRNELPRTRRSLSCGNAPCGTELAEPRSPFVPMSRRRKAAQTDQPRALRVAERVHRVTDRSAAVQVSRAVRGKHERQQP